MIARSAGLLLLAAAATGCRGDATAPAASTVTLQVSVTTWGPYPDHDGYLAVLDDSLTRSVGPDGTVSFVTTARPHWLRLEGIATTCIPAGDNPRWVDLTGKAARDVRFVISCAGVSEQTGGFTVRIDNRGAVPAKELFRLSLSDPLGICLWVNRCTIPVGRTVSVAENTPTAVLDLPGGRVLALRLQLPPNCTPAAGNLDRVTVIARQITPLFLEVTCR